MHAFTLRFVLFTAVLVNAKQGTFKCDFGDVQAVESANSSGLRIQSVLPPIKRGLQLCGATAPDLQSFLFVKARTTGKQIGKSSNATELNGTSYNPGPRILGSQTECQNVPFRVRFAA